MIVLGFDTATSATAVGLRLADASTLERRDDPREGEHPGHATRLLPFAAELLARAGLEWDAIDRIAVGTGPGRFTGLRVGVATARGLAQSLRAELVGVSSLRALAHGAAPEYPDRPLLAVIDARRGEVFTAAYAAGAQDRGHEIDFGPPLRPAELAAAVSRADDLGGPGRGVVAVGDGAVRYRAELEEHGAMVPQDADPAHLIGTHAICALGLSAPVHGARDVVPDYRRDADAAIARAARAPAGRV
ncbi:MAG TPA: tRNA (adenosine(37)-N6)-threonylcarbamoyltransferase complex dimerization subunit type 1 TsaB [Solirubrobacteraceae bacterium]|nr:tRNA (adenosine(37)-N6)-threonylcarbamoyltransferase complex dimerization subunit type 1 TsaB [Solirubrobacteraceae bacterium]